MSTWTYDLSTDIGQVRLLIGDTDIDPTSAAVFTDEELQFFLTREGSVNSAAAAALEATAASKARLAKAIKSLNFSEDTRGAAKELRETAALLRANDPDANLYGVAEIAQTDASVVEILSNNALRGG